MKRLSILFAALILVAAEPAPATPDEDAKNLEGTWKEVSREYQGDAVPKRFLEKSKLVFKGDGKLTMIDGLQVERTFKIDPSKTPRTIDIIESFTKADNAGKPVTVEMTNVGIYKLDGDNLTLCYARSDGPKAGQRPKEFKAGAKSGLFLSTYVREKP